MGVRRPDDTAHSGLIASVQHIAGFAGAHGLSGDPGATRAFDAVSLALWRRMRDAEHTRMMFALALGGEPMRITRAELAAGPLGPGVGVIQHLSEDGRLPGSWRASEEAELRASIATHLAG